MAKSTPIRVGIVGIGRAGWGMHLPELKEKETMFEIAAGCDLLAERRNMFSEKHNCPVYARIEDLLQDPNIELVDIATRSRDHYSHAALALKAGKHVFLEKPMTLDYAQARKLQALSDKSNGKLFIRHNRRFEPCFVHVSEIIASGILGEVYEIKLRRLGYQRRDDWQTIQEHAGGQLLNWGPHIIDHGLRFLGAPLKSVWSKLKLVAALGDAEDHLKIILTGENDRIVDLEISGGAALSEPVYMVLGTRGALTSDENSITIKYLDPKKKLKSRRASSAVPPVTGSFGNPETLSWVENTFPVAPSGPAGMTHIWDELYAALRKDRKYPVPLEQAVEVMRVISLAKKNTQFDAKR